jgi:glycosyltransferase involved in cell wall biosynthesis
MPTRVLLVAPDSSGGGGQRTLAGLARHLPAFGYQPSAVLFQHGVLEDWLRDVNCPVSFAPFGRLRYPYDVVRTVAGVRRAARESGAAIVVTNGSVGHIYGGLAASSLRLPSVMWQQIIPNRDVGGPKMTRPVLERVAAKVPAAAIVVLSDAATAAQRELSPKRRLRKAYPGIDLEAVRARRGCGAALRRAEGWTDETVIGIVGWLLGWKGQDVFLRACADLAPRWPDTRFVVVGGPGDADFERELHQLARDLGIGDRVLFTGHRDDAYDWFDAMDIVVHSSWGSPFDLVALEALALAKPLVATSFGGTAEAVVLDGETGLLVPPGDPAATAAAVERFLRDPAAAAAMGETGSRHVDQFSEQCMAERFAAVLDEVLER